jgi:hypothetical protein
LVVSFAVVVFVVLVVGVLLRRIRGLFVPRKSAPVRGGQL